MHGEEVFEEGKGALVANSPAGVSGARKGVAGSAGGSVGGKTPPPAGSRKVHIDKASPSVGTPNRKTLQSGPSAGGGGGGGGQGKGSKAKKQS